MPAAVVLKEKTQLNMARGTKLTLKKKKSGGGAFDGYIVSVQSAAVVSSPRDKLTNDQKGNVTYDTHMNRVSLVLFKPRMNWDSSKCPMKQ